MMGVKSHNSCTDLFKNPQILAFLIKLLNSVTNHEEYFQMNADVHSVNTRHKHCLHKPITILPCIQKIAYYAEIIILNNQTSNFKCFMNE
jgi:hypothetical protein